MTPPLPSPAAAAAKSNHAAVRLNDMPWFHGKILRERAEDLLDARNSPDGLFLVRESTNFPGDYTLCVVFQKKVEHYRVIARNNSLTIDEEETFENLTKLVEVRDCSKRGPGTFRLQDCQECSGDYHWDTCQLLKKTWRNYPIVCRFLQHYKQDADGLCTQLTQSKSNSTTTYRDVDIQAFKEAGWVINEADIKVRKRNRSRSLAYKDDAESESAAIY